MTRAIALVLTILTGFSGLVYQVAWQKYLATLLGSHSEATAAVLAVFLGGLAVGYAVFGSVTARMTSRAAQARGSAPLLRLYGVVESGIGVYALLFPWLFGGAEAVSFMVPVGREGLSFAFDVLLAILLLGPPTVLMGGTIPILTQALSARLEEATRVHAWVYAFNTLGAFGGALVGGFLLVPLLGLDGVLRSMGVVNLAAGCIFLALHRFAKPGPSQGGAERATAAAPSRRFLLYGCVALLGGFAMMAVQTALNRVGGLAFGASHFTFAMVVAVFVLCIAIGSFVVSALREIPPLLIVASQWLLVALLAAVYFVLGDAPYWAHALRSLFRDVDPAFHAYHGLAFLGILALLAVPVGLSGALLPLLFHHLRREIGDLGAVAGRLYSWNTTGSLLGALLGGYALFFWLDLHEVYRVALCASALGAGLLTALVMRARVAGFALAAACVAGLAALPAWSPERIASGLFRVREPVAGTFEGPDVFFARNRGVFETIFHADDPAVTVTVSEAPLRTGGRTRSIATNGKPDGNLHADYTTMAMAGLLPALFAGNPEHAFVIGWGTGVTVGELAKLADVRSVEVAEISAAVLEAAPLFDYGNLNAARNPKVRTMRGDAYRALLRSEGRFGVISSEPSNPWMTGVEMLFSREFLEAARERLAPGGVYAQWFHLYEVDRATVELVLRTYAEVFPRVSAWFATGDDLLVLGFDEEVPALDLERLARRFARTDFSAGFARAGVHRFEELLMHEVLPLGALHAASLEGPIHTLRHPILSHQASRAFFRGKRAELPRLVHLEAERVGGQNSLLRRVLADPDGRLAEDLLASFSTQTCRMGRPIECGTVHARWLRDHPDSERRERELAEVRLFAGGQLAEHLEDELLEQIASLHAGAEPIRGGADPMQAALDVTGLYNRYYHHAIPFDRRVLADVWRRCGRNARLTTTCGRAREEVERHMGPLVVR